MDRAGRGWSCGRIASAAFGIALAAATPAVAADLLWEVENPFRLHKQGHGFALHEKAFAELRGQASGPLPPDIVWRIERKLNDPDCRDASTPATCGATARARYAESRLGWAAKTLAQLCYDNAARPRRYPTVCERRYGWGSAKEDLILPEAHTVAVRIAPERLAQLGAAACTWSWQPRGRTGKTETKTQPCKDRLLIARVPYAPDSAKSGVAVEVKLPNAPDSLRIDVVVEDLLVVSLGDSFASGESNPDRPVTFSPGREMVYDPNNARDTYELSFFSPPPNFGPLPKRLMEDEAKGVIHKPSSAEFRSAFDKAGAQWMSPDCHRSQYGYPMRVGMQLALENRRRAITMVHLACSGSEVTEGLFLDKDAREGFDHRYARRVPAQFDQLTDLLCTAGPGARGVSHTYALPFFKHGDTRTETREVGMRWCPQGARKRPIDLVLLSIGGNDVGFSAIAAYAITESASDLAPIVGWIGREIRFGPDIARSYLNVLDERLKAVRDALRDGFGVSPPQVVQTSYEPIQFDEAGKVCGSNPTLGMDVHPNLKVSSARVQEAVGFTRELLSRLECITDGQRGSCPTGLATGRGTEFRLVTEHLQKFARRGFCARDPSRVQIDAVMMGMPRKSQTSGEFEPFSPAYALPYGRRWRLIHTPNDAFLTANTHREDVSAFDLLQPAYAGLYSGAMHPTAEGHAMVADSVMPHARAVVDKRRTAER